MIRRTMSSPRAAARAEVLVRGAEHAIVRPRPSYEDLIGLDRVPAWLG